MSSKDFENGAKYNEELGGQANSTKREHFEQAMRFHQVANAGERKKRVKTKKMDQEKDTPVQKIKTKDKTKISGGRHSCSKEGHRTEGGE